MARKYFPKNYLGQTFGWLTIIEEITPPEKAKLPLNVLCKCKCGKEVKTNIGRVVTGNTKSCGCFVFYQSRRTLRTHGLRYHPLYKTWLNMTQRCSNPNVKCFKYYGGKGVTVCDRWLSFENFYNDIIEGYAPGLEIDRIDPEGDYSPDNFQWSSHKKNSQRRDYCKLDYRKAELIRERFESVKRMSEIFNVSTGAIRHVLKNKTWVK